MWSVLDFTSCIPTLSACKWLPYMEWLQLWGVWLAIGQIVLPVGCFSVSSWFPFFRAPLPFPSLSAPIHLHMAQDKHSYCFTLAFFQLIFVPFWNHWPHTVAKKSMWTSLVFCINCGHNIIKSPKLIPFKKCFGFYCLFLLNVTCIHASAGWKSMLTFEAVPQHLNQVGASDRATPKAVFSPGEAILFNFLPCFRSSSCCLTNPLLSFSLQTDGLRFSCKMFW